MNKIYKFTINLLFLLSFTFIYHNLCSQNQTGNDNVAYGFIESTNTIFGNLNMQKIPSGILIDKTPILSNFYKYDGKHPELLIDNDSILQVYSELYYALFDKSELKDVFSFHDDAKEFSANNSGTIPLGLIFCDYQKILPNAFENGDLKIVKDIVYDNSNSINSPYSDEIIVCIAPILDVDANSDNISFELDPDFILTNKQYSQIKVKIGEELLWQDIEPNEPISISNTLNAEDVILNFKIITENRTYYSSSIIQQQVQNKEDIIEPDNVFNLGDGNKYGVWLGCNNSHIRKPLVIIEGYDPQNVRELESPDLENNLYHLMNQQNMAENYRNMGFDIVILDFGDSHSSIEHQAQVVKTFFNHVNNELSHNNSSHELFLIAASQAGLISRYALCSMENEDIDHRVKLFITFDSPHQGANIPLSLQNFVRFLSHSYPLFWLNKIKEAKEILDAHPTKQMLLYHYC